MGWAEGGVCRKHPNHGQSEGVCSSCVAERLAKLSSSNKNVASCSSASPASHINTSDVMAPSNALRKSRSMATSRVDVDQSNEEVEAKKKKKGGFWSKLLRSSGKRSKEAEF